HVGLVTGEELYVNVLVGELVGFVEGEIRSREASAADDTDDVYTVQYRAAGMAGIRDVGQLFQYCCGEHRRARTTATDRNGQVNLFFNHRRLGRVGVSCHVVKNVKRQRHKGPAE